MEIQTQILQDGEFKEGAESRKAEAKINEHEKRVQRRRRP